MKDGVIVLENAELSAQAFSLAGRGQMDLRRQMYRKALHVPMNAIAGDVSNRVAQFLSDVREVFLGIGTLFGKFAREPFKAVCVLAVALWLEALLNDSGLPPESEKRPLTKDESAFVSRFLP